MSNSANSHANNLEQNKLPTLGKSVQNVFSFSLPIILNALFAILPSLASMWILSRLGKDQLAAAGIATPTFYVIITLFASGFYAVGIKVGHSFGKDKNNPDIGRWVRNGIFLALLLSIPAAIVLLNVHFLLLWFGQDPHLVKIAEPYFAYGALGVITSLMGTSLNQYFSGMGHPKISLVISLITLPFTVALSYVLVLGRMGFPQLGLGGINCAAFIIGLIMVLYSIAIAMFAKWSKPHKIFSRPMNISYQRCRELFQLGWPISIQVSGELSAMTAVAYLLGLFGPSALAAAQITSQFIIIYVMIAMGLSQGVSVLVSQAYGAKNMPQVKQVMKSGMIIIAAITFIFVIALVFFSTSLVDLYLDIHHPTHSRLVYLASRFMMIAAVYISFDGVRSILTATLRGLHDSKLPMRIGIAGYWLIGLPCAYIAGFLFHGGPIALRLAYVSGVIVATLWLSVRYKNKMNSAG